VTPPLEIKHAFLVVRCAQRLETQPYSDPEAAEDLHAIKERAMVVRVENNRHLEVGIVTIVMQRSVAEAREVPADLRSIDYIRRRPPDPNPFGASKRKIPYPSLL